MTHKEESSLLETTVVANWGALGRNGTKLQQIMNIPPMLAASGGCAHVLALDENGGVWSWGFNANGQLGMGNTSNQPVPALVPSLREMEMSALVALEIGRAHV